MKVDFSGKKSASSWLSLGPNGQRLWLHSLPLAPQWTVA